MRKRALFLAILFALGMAASVPFTSGAASRVCTTVVSTVGTVTTTVVSTVTNTYTTTVYTTQPAAPADFTWTPTSPTVGQNVTFTVTDPAPGVTYGWDRTLDGVAEATGNTYTYAYSSTGTKTMRLYDGTTLIAEHTLTVAAAPPTGDPLPTFEVTIKPNYLHTSDNPASNYNSLWIYPKSPTTPYRSPDSYKQQSRYLLLDPRYTDADGRVGKDEWWFIIERNWPASYDSTQHGQWGRETNFHNVGGDAGPAGSGGVGWGFGAGSSALALDWNSNATAPSIDVLSTYQSQGGFDHLLPMVTRDAWHTYVLHWIAGRTDGTTVRPGSIQVWADGTKVLDRTNLNTVQRAQGPDGVYYVQRWMQLWEGDYTQNLPLPATTRVVLTRIGNTYTEAVNDRPFKFGDTLAGQYYSGTGTNYGPPTLTQLPSRLTSDSILPSGL